MEKPPLLPPGTIVDSSKAHITPRIPDGPPLPAKAPKTTSSRPQWERIVLFLATLCLVSLIFTPRIGAFAALVTLLLPLSVFEAKR
jgi:hypothetical protein